MFDNGIIDGGLCHGSSGIARIFSRMFHNTKIKEFKDTSDYWIKQTLFMSKYSDGLCGFKANGKTLEYGLLSGISGIALTMLSFLIEEDIFWDECLLLS